MHIASGERVEDCRRRIESLEIERGIIDREENVGVDVGARRTDVDAHLASERDRLVGLEKRWQDEKVVVDKVLALRAQLRGGDKPVDAQSPETAPPDRARLLAELQDQQVQLETIQGESPLIMPSVDAQAVASVVGVSQREERGGPTNVRFPGRY